MAELCEVFGEWKGKVFDESNNMIYNMCDLTTMSNYEILQKLRNLIFVDKMNYKLFKSTLSHGNKITNNSLKRFHNLVIENNNLLRNRGLYDSIIGKYSKYIILLLYDFNNLEKNYVKLEEIGLMNSKKFAIMLNFNNAEYKNRLTNYFGDLSRNLNLNKNKDNQFSNFIFYNSFNSFFFYNSLFNEIQENKNNNNNKNKNNNNNNNNNNNYCKFPILIEKLGPKYMRELLKDFYNLLEINNLLNIEYLEELIKDGYIFERKQKDFLTRKYDFKGNHKFVLDNIDLIDIREFFIHNTSIKIPEDIVENWLDAELITNPYHRIQEYSNEFMDKHIELIKERSGHNINNNNYYFKKYINFMPDIQLIRYNNIITSCSRHETMLEIMVNKNYYNQILNMNKNILLYLDLKLGFNYVSILKYIDIIQNYRYNSMINLHNKYNYTLYFIPDKVFLLKLRVLPQIKNNEQIRFLYVEMKYFYRKLEIIRKAIKEFVWRPGSDLMMKQFYDSSDNEIYT